MRAYVPGYELRTIRSLSEALELMADEPSGWRPFAGGTDIMVLFAAGGLKHRRFVNLWGMKELRTIHVDTTSITLGALTTYSDILRHATLRSKFPLLSAAAEATGSVAIQNRGTVGGNIMNGSPAADMPPAFLVYDAEVELTSVRGTRWIPYGSFHTGYKQMRCQPDELLTAVRLPRKTGRWRFNFTKVGPRNAQAISKVCFAGLHNKEQNEVRIAFGSVAPVPLRCFQTETAIREGGDALAVLAAEVSPITDLRSTAEYRRRVAQNLLREFLYGEN